MVKYLLIVLMCFCFAKIISKNQSGCLNPNFNSKLSAWSFPVFEH